jgi:acetyl-CoA acyltransferase
MTVYTREGWVVADRDQPPRPDTTLEGLRHLKKTPFRIQGKVTAGNATCLTDGAAGVLLMSAEKAKELGVIPKMRLIGFSYAGVRPDVMGYGPIPATKKVLAMTGLTINDIGLIELNETFGVQCVQFMREFGLELPDDQRLNPLGGAIAFGHPLAGSGPRLVTHLIHHFAERPSIRYGLTALCVGLGQGAAVIWENLQTDEKRTQTEY